MFKGILILSLIAFLNCKYNGIDVSVWQGPDVDFKKVKADGINFVIIRAGISTSTDKYFESNYKKAKAAGLNVGVYWYAKAMSEKASTEEAKACLKAISGKQLEYPVYYDIEQKEILAKGKTYCSAIAKNFCTLMENNKKFCGIYASKSYFDNYFTDEIKTKYTIWVAQYYSKCTYTGPYGIWQRSSSGSIKGISGRVDLDISYKDFPSIIKKAHLNGF